MNRPRLVLAGWHGDDRERSHRVLEGLVSGLRTRRPDVEILAIGPDRHAITSRHGIAGVPIGDPATIDGALAGAAGVLLGGGPPWRDTELTALGGVAALLSFDGPGSSPRRWRVGLPAVLQVALLTAIRGVPLHLHGVRFESFEDDGALGLVSLLSRAAESVSAGDDETATRLALLAARAEPVPVVEDAVAALDVVAELVPRDGAPPGLAPGRLRRRRDP
jgi:hypothetical protein